MSDTIYALSTPPGRGGIAVVRVSGPGALRSAEVLTGKPIEPMALRTVRDTDSRETIDRCLVLTFQNPRSYTGENVAEYHVHGSRAVVTELLRALARQEGHRMAEPGEFTKRAFMNGKMDLTEAEAVADLIDAETAAQKNQALSQLSGALSDLYHGWAERLAGMLAHAEAEIEFPDEDLPGDIIAEMAPEIRKMLQEMLQHLNDGRRGERLREGVRVAVIGAPNAGKSSLVNALAQRDVAIVSDVAGTTRDVIEVHLDLGGYPVVIADTAGLRPEHVEASGHDKIENEGMKRALERARKADIKVLVFDGTAAEADGATQELIDESGIVVVNKCDQDAGLEIDGALRISAQSGEGLAALIAALSARAAELAGGTGEAPSLTRARHREALEEAAERLESALTARAPELMAEDLRLGVRGIGRITGRVDVEDLLGRIFADFCIGK